MPRLRGAKATRQQNQAEPKKVVAKDNAGTIRSKRSSAENNVENQGNNGTSTRKITTRAAVVRANAQPTGDATKRKNPLATVVGNASSSSTAVGSLTHVAPSQRLEGSGLCRIGLVRVPDIACPDNNTLMAAEPIPIYSGAILGRTSKESMPPMTFPSSSGQTKVDLGMDAASSPGVSRQQLQVVQVEPDSITIRQSPNAVNPVAIARYSSSTNTMSDLVTVRNNEQVQLLLGDLIVFDHYVMQINQNLPGEQLPLHIFRVVSLEPSQAVTSPPPDTLPCTTTPQQQNAVLSAATRSEISVSNQTPSSSICSVTKAPSLLDTTVDFDSSSIDCFYKDEKKLPVASAGADADGSSVNRRNARPSRHVAFAKEVASEEGKNEERNQEVLTETKSGKEVRDPKPGDRFRVWYEHCEDAFGKRKGAQGWFFATVTKILSLSKLRMEICYDDLSLDQVTYPDKDMQMICALPHQSKYYADLGTPSQQLAYDANPKEVELGDLVFCLYQKGGSNGARYRGRVAMVNRDHTVEVAYDDGEYECKVPVADGNVYLVCRGQDDLSWMYGLEVVITVRGEQKEGTIVKNETSNSEKDVAVRFKNDGVETFPYDCVVRELMKPVKMRAQEHGKVLDWPEPNTKQVGRNKRPKSEAADKEKATESQPRKRRAVLESTPCSSTSIPDSDEDCLLPTLAGLLPFGEDQSNELVPLVAVKHQYYASTSPGEESVLEPLQEMDSSFAKALWNALNSSESHYGAQLMGFTTRNLKQVPTVDVLRNLIGLITFGPMHSRSSPYPDGVKPELALDYVKSLMPNPVHMARLIDATLPNYWLDCIRQATNTTYCATGDEGRVTVAALRRTGNSLQVSACCEELFGALLEFELKGMKGNQEAVLQREYRSKAIVGAMVGCSDGVRQLLKTVTRAMAHVLIWYGHHILGDETIVRDSQVMYDALDLCHTQAQRLVSALGSICTNVAWLYSAENGSDDVLALDCASVMQESFDVEFMEKQFDPSLFLGLRTGAAAADQVIAKHWERIKFHFVSSLKEPIALELRRRLAYGLGIKKVYDICYGDLHKN